MKSDDLRAFWARLIILGGCCVAPPVAVAQVTTTVSVPATNEWTDTKIDLLPGDILSVRAGGEWSNAASGLFVGPSGYATGAYPGTTLPGAPLAALIARIGTTITLAPLAPTNVRSRGHLHLGMNDVPGTYGDNRGALNAFIRYVQQQVPTADFMGRSLEEARKWLGAFQYSPIVEHGPSEFPAGHIYNQDPKPGVDLHGVTAVRLFVSTGPTILVPDVIGLARAQAEALIKKARLRAIYSGAEDSEFRQGVVLRTHPVPGASIDAAAAVNYWLASGENTVPDVRGELTSQAHDILRRAGFHNTATEQRLTLSDPGHVLQQVPAANTLARLDTLISLTESRTVPRVFAIFAIVVTAFLGATGVAARVVKRRRIRKTRARVHVDAHLDLGGKTTAVKEPRLRGPSVHLRVALEDGETSSVSSMPVVKQEVRDE